MLYNPKHDDRLHALAQQLRLARSVTPDLMADIVAEACVRLPLLQKAGTAADHFAQLVKASAWTDAVLALIELELPQWKLRRLVYEDGEWLCSLSQEPGLPVELDETADGNHEIRSLAILSAFVETRRHTTATFAEGAPSVPRTKSASGSAVCCDNFA
jgi:hypothetical protein